MWGLVGLIDGHQPRPLERARDDVVARHGVKNHEKILLHESIDLDALITTVLSILIFYRRKDFFPDKKL